MKPGLSAAGVRRFLPLGLLLILLAGVLWLSETETGIPLPLGERERRSAAAGTGLRFFPPGGAYGESQSLVIRPTVSRAPVIFTTDGSVPSTTLGTLYERPFLLDAAAPGVVTVRAREFIDGALGPVTSTSYWMGPPPVWPVVSLIVDPPDLWDESRGLLTHVWERGDDWERPAHVTYFAPEGGGFALPGGVRIQGDGAAATASRPALRLSFRSEYGPAQLVYPLFPGHPEQPPEGQSYKRLVLTPVDATTLQDYAAAATATGMGLATVQERPVLLFINGRSWGAYLLSERLDRFFLEDNLGLQHADLIRNGNAEAGDAAAWEALTAWVAAQDFDDPAAYAELQARVDWPTLVDAAVLQDYFGFPARALWAARSTGGGRWFFIYGGGSPSFALSAGAPWALQRADGRPDGEMAELLTELLESERFRKALAERAADLINAGILPADDVISQTLAFRRELAAIETGRWSGAGEVSEDFDAARAAALERAAAVRADLGLRAGYTQTTEISVGSPIDPAWGDSVCGSFFINGLSPERQDLYFVGSSLRVIAIPTEGSAFVGWSGLPDAGKAAAITVTVSPGMELGGEFRRSIRAAGDGPLSLPNAVMINEYWINDNGTAYASLGGRPITGDWLELRVQRGGIDLRGWRVTDNDTRTGTAEGSLIFPDLPALADVPGGTILLIVATEDPVNAANYPRDDLDPGDDGRMLFYVGNGHLDTTTDPGFAIGNGNEALALLAPGAGPGFGDDVGVDFVAEGRSVTPYSFGILEDGVQFVHPFRRLGDDDGALLTLSRVNDNGAAGWRVDPTACESGERLCLESGVIVSPGAPNIEPQDDILLQIGLCCGLPGIGAVLGGGIWLWGAIRRRRRAGVRAQEPDAGRLNAQWDRE